MNDRSPVSCTARRDRGRRDRRARPAATAPRYAAARPAASAAGSPAAVRRASVSVLRLGLIAALVAAAGCAESSPPQLEVTRLSPPPPAAAGATDDVLRAPAGARVEAQFRIRNTGGRELVVHGLVRDCDCARRLRRAGDARRRRGRDRDGRVPRAAQ